MYDLLKVASPLGIFAPLLTDILKPVAGRTSHNEGPAAIHSSGRVEAPVSFHPRSLVRVKIHQLIIFFSEVNHTLGNLNQKTDPNPYACEYKDPTVPHPTKDLRHQKPQGWERSDVL